MKIIEEAKKYVMYLFNQSKEEPLAYHNWEHTENVFETAELIIANTQGLSEDDQIAIKLASIFHDVGYVDTLQNHEEKGAEYAEKFLLEHEQSEKLIKEVKRLIMATRLTHTPKDLLEEILIDADLSHLGKEDYFETSFKNLPKELKQCSNQSFSESEWLENCINFLSSHNFLTAYGREKFGPVKEKNIEKLKEKLKIAKEEEKEEKEKKKDEKVTPSKRGQKNPLKGVETMFKTALRNHVDISAIADRKANTLTSVNAIIISIVLSALFPKLDSNPFLFYPSVTILISSFVTIILSILSTIPAVTRGEISKEDVRNKKGNLLFFGNFHGMSLDDYQWSVRQLMESKDYIYSSMSTDLFFLGKVLNKKYKLLRIAYYVFILGLFSSIIVFIFNVMPYIGSTSEIEFKGIGLF